jgi:hypothetical protein
MGAFYQVLFWFTVVTTAMSGGLGFLLKLPNFYHPNAYLVYNSNGQLTAGSGTTPFEVVSTYVFAMMYLIPLSGMLFAHWQGSAAAKRAAILTPFIYHAASVYGVIIVFPHGLNPAVASLSAAAGLHVVYAFLFALLFWLAEDNAKPKSQ